MSDTKVIPIKPDFNMDELMKKFTQVYQQKGFEVMPTKLGKGASVQVSKDDDGIKKFVGLALGITVNLSVSEDKTNLIVNFTDAEWTGKIIGLAVGWLLCFIPFFIAGYGAIKQSSFPKEIAKDIQVLL